MFQIYVRVGLEWFKVAKEIGGVCETYGDAEIACARFAYNFPGNYKIERI